MKWIMCCSITWTPCCADAGGRPGPGPNWDLSFQSLPLGEGGFSNSPRGRANWKRRMRGIMDALKIPTRLLKCTISPLISHQNRFRSADFGDSFPQGKPLRPAAAVAPKGRQIHTTNSAINENLKRCVSLKGEQACIMYLYEITIFAKKYIFIDLVVEFLRLLC